MRRRMRFGLQIALIGLLGGLIPLGSAQQSKAPANGAGTSAAPVGASATKAAQNKPSGKEAATDPEKVVLSVGDHKMTARDIENILNDLPPQSRAYYSGPGKKDLPQYLIQMKILGDEAKKAHLEDKPEIRRRLETARESILADAERKRIDNNIQISDADLKEYYEKRKSDFDEVRIRRILIRTERSVLNPYMPASKPPLSSDEARKKLEKLRAEILKGADFAQEAQANSDDLNTAGKGGDMGYINRQMVVPPIADAAYSLKTGQVSEIISTPYGLEIIKVEDRRVKPFAEVKSSLEQDYRKRKFWDAYSEMAKAYKLSIDIIYFGASIRVEQTNVGNKPAQK